MKTSLQVFKGRFEQAKGKKINKYEDKIMAIIETEKQEREKIEEK